MHQRGENRSRNVDGLANFPHQAQERRHLLRAEQLLHLEEKYYECQLEEFKIAAELEKAEREKEPEAPDELSKATLEALVLKHTGKDMSTWKLARRKLAALLPPEVIAEAVEERRRQQVDSEEEEEEEEEENIEVDDSWNNDEDAPEDIGDISIWKGRFSVRRSSRP